MTHEHERDTVRAELAATARILGRLGFQYGLAGHLTVRDPGDEELYWVNPAGLPFTAVSADDTVLVAPDGRVVEGRHEAHGYDSQIEVHRARPELRAGVHVHSTHTFAWSSAGRELSALTTDSAWLDGIQAVRESLQDPIVPALGPTARILIQRSHGAVAFGETLAEAAFYFLSVERAAYTQLLLEAAGRAQEITAELNDAWRLPPRVAHAQFHALIDQELGRVAGAELQAV
ncbi:MAG: class II aldolase/adducin family protein [Microbacterium sp.]